MKYLVLLGLIVLIVEVKGQNVQSSFWLESYQDRFQEFFDSVDEPIQLQCDTSGFWNGIYRFTWLPSFDNPIIVTIKRENQEVIAIGKFIVLQRPEDYSKISNIRTDTVRLEWRHWLDFTTSELDAALFWFLPENSINPKTDGAAWLIEAVTPQGNKGSKKVYLHSPRKNSSIYNVGLYLTRLFDFEELY